MSLLYKDAEMTLNDVGLILGTSVKVSVIVTDPYAVFVDLHSGNGAIAYLLSKTGKVKGSRDIYRVLKVLPWDRVILALLGGE